MTKEGRSGKELDSDRLEKSTGHDKLNQGRFRDGGSDCLTNVFRMRGFVMRFTSVAFTCLFLLSTSRTLFAAGAIETTGDILAIVLPATAGGLTLAYPGSEGSGKV